MSKSHRETLCGSLFLNMHGHVSQGCAVWVVVCKCMTHLTGMGCVGRVNPKQPQRECVYYEN